MLLIDKAGLPERLVNRLSRLAAFQNPEFYQAQSLRFSTFGKPRIIGCAEDFPKHLALPRGCANEVRIYDYVDADVPPLARMFNKRLRGYRAMGYAVADTAAVPNTSDLPLNQP